MLVQCQGCGAPLEVERGNAFARCSYCGLTNRVKGHQTLAAEQPRPPEPVPVMRPQPTAPQPAPPPPRPPSRSPARLNGASCLPFVGLGITAIALFGSFASTSELWATLPFFGIQSEGAPSLGRLTLGAAPPAPLQGEASGDVDATALGAGCRGHVPRAPHVLIETTGSASLVVEVTESPSDLVLVVRTADGVWHCDDDGGQGTLPRLQLAVGPGAHRVWVGTYGSAGRAPFTLSVRGVESDAPPIASGVAPDATPTLAAVAVGAAPPSGVWPGRAEGWVPGANLDPRCRGSFPVTPHLRINASAPTAVRLVTRDATEDLVMAVRTPTGAWICDDDGGDGLNPEIDATLAVGVSAVFVGTFHADRVGTFTLELSGPGERPAGGHGLRPDAAPILGTVNLDLGAGPTTHEGVVRPEVDARELDPRCRGWVGGAPDLVVVTTIPRAVTIRTEGEEDLTLVVRAADGTLRCDDDSGGARNAAVSQTLAPGTTQIWVGSFRHHPDERITLRVEPAGP